MRTSQSDVDRLQRAWRMFRAVRACGQPVYWGIDGALWLDAADRLSATHDRAVAARILYAAIVAASRRPTWEDGTPWRAGVDAMRVIPEPRMGILGPEIDPAPPEHLARWDRALKVAAGRYGDVERLYERLRDTARATEPDSPVTADHLEQAADLASALRSAALLVESIGRADTWGQVQQ